MLLVLTITTVLVLDIHEVEWDTDLMGQQVIYFKVLALAELMVTVLAEWLLHIISHFQVLQALVLEMEAQEVPMVETH
jgi:hypothetical protein